ncbi:uncharacterized protein BDV17DRAFT_292267 [Aspergillus undulatus]|uniref:uncharacterized protein n=1 Tax=Aspergillus undulatus TaxID=1810928 RepID=UPI003CCDD638
MSRTVTEIVTLSFTPETNVSEPVAKAIPIISRQPGFRGLKWGSWEEDQTKVQMMIHWDDISSHITFTQSNEYPDLLYQLEGILTATPSIIHVHFEGGDEKISKLLSDPIVELATFFNPTDGFEGAMSHTLVVGSQSEGCLGYVRGEVVEEIAPVEGKAKGKAAYAAISWTSLQARLEATKREEVVQSGGRVVGSVGGYEVHHVQFQ